MGIIAGCEIQILKAGKANRKRIRQIVQWPCTRRLSQSIVFRNPRLGSQNSGDLATRVQRFPPHSLFGNQTAGSDARAAVELEANPNIGQFNPLRPLESAANEQNILSTCLDETDIFFC